MAFGTVGASGLNVGNAYITVKPVIDNSALNHNLGQAGHAGAGNLVSGLESGVNSHRSRLGRLGSGLGHTVAAGIGTALKASAAVGAGLGALFAIGVKNAASLQEATAKTNQVIKSTGGAANVTSQQIGKLSSAIELYSGYGDDAVRSAANLLLTFTNIRNEAGKNNDIFNQTTKITVDMSTALGQDLKSSAIQVGKALNDPVKGVTALQRVGVSFTAQQRDQIKTLVESGKTLDAQKLILGELQKEFGGTAKAAGSTFSGQLKIAKSVAGDFLRELATPFLGVFTSGLRSANGLIARLTPEIGKIGKTVADKVGPALKVAGEAWDTFIGGFQNPQAKIGPGVSGMQRIFLTVGAVTRQVFDNIGKTLGRVGDLFATVGKGIAKNFGPVLKDVGQFITTSFLPAFRKVSSIIQNNVAKVFDTLADVFTTKILPALRTIAGFIIRDVLPVLVKIWSVVESALIPAFRKVAQVIISLVGHAFQVIAKFLREHRQQIMSIVNVLGTLIKWFAKVVGWIIQHLAPVLGVILKTAFDVVIRIIGVCIDIIGGLIGAFRTAGHVIAIIWTGLAAGISTVYHTIIEPIWNAIHTALDGIKTAFQVVKDGIKKIWDGLVKVFKTPIKTTLDVVNTFDHIVNNVTKLIGLGRPLPEDLHLATGGLIPGGYGGGDRVPVLAEPGEVMLRKETVRAMGGPQLVHEHFNRKMMGFGGPVTTYGLNTYTKEPTGGLNPFGGLFDAGKWVLSEAAHLLRQGAAAALSAAVAPIRALLNPLGSSGAAGWVHHAIDHTFDQIIDWIKGKESGLSGTLIEYKGGSNTVGLIEGLAKALGFAGMPVTSTFRPGAGYHGVYEAVDFSNGPGYGPGSQTAQELALDLAFAKNYGPSIAELIHAQPGAINIKDGKVVDGLGFYGASTMLDHWNHVHVAISPESIARGNQLLTARGTHDQGGILPHGYAAVNLSGKPEAVLTDAERQALKSGLSGKGGMFAGATVNIGGNTDLDLAYRRWKFDQRKDSLR